MFRDIIVNVEGSLAELELLDHVLTCLDCLFHLGIDTLEVGEDLMETGTLLVIELQHFVDEILP